MRKRKIPTLKVVSQQKLQEQFWRGAKIGFLLCLAMVIVALTIWV